MPYFEFIWTEANTQHIDEHGVTCEELEYVVRHAASVGTSRSTGKSIARGYTQHGRYIMVVYEQIDDITIYPVTAFDIREP